MHCSAEEVQRSVCLVSCSFAEQAVFYHLKLWGTPSCVASQRGPGQASCRQSAGRSVGRGHRVLSQACLLLQLPGSAERTVHLDIVFSTLQCRLVEFSCDFPWHTCIFLIKVVSWLSIKKRLGVAGQGCHSLLLSFYLHLFVSELCRCCKILLFHGQWTREISRHFICCEERDPKLLIYKLRFLTLAQCLPPGLRGLQLGSVTTVLFSVPKLSFSFCTCCKKCICSRNDCKEKPLGNCKEITKGLLDGNDFQSLKLWQDSWKQEIPPLIPQALSQSPSSLPSESLSHVGRDKY